MNRFLIGLILGGAGSGATWVLGGSPYWIAGVGLAVAVLIWFGAFILDDLL